MFSEILCSTISEQDQNSATVNSQVLLEGTSVSSGPPLQLTNVTRHDGPMRFSSYDAITNLNSASGTFYDMNRIEKL